MRAGAAATAKLRGGAGPSAPGTERRLAKVCAAWFVASFLGAALPLAAHPYHATVAEAEIKPADHVLEVSLRVLPEDLRTAFEERGGATPETVGFDRAVTGLLRDTFTVTDTAGARRPLAFIGKEISVQGVWLYFEISLPDDLHGLVLSNRLLLDVAPTQINTAVLRRGEERRTLTLTRQHPEDELLTAPAAASP